MKLDSYSESSVEKTVNELNALGFDIEKAGNELHMPSTALDIFHSPTKSTFPFMDIVEGKLWLRMNGKNICRTAKHLDAKAIKTELRKLDNYINSVSLANCGGCKGSDGPC